MDKDITNFTADGVTWTRDEMGTLTVWVAEHDPQVDGCAAYMRDAGRVHWRASCAKGHDRRLHPWPTRKGRVSSEGAARKAVMAAWREMAQETGR